MTAQQQEQAIRRACLLHGQSTLKRTETDTAITLHMTHGRVTISKADGSYQWQRPA